MVGGWGTQWGLERLKFRFEIYILLKKIGVNYGIVNCFLFFLLVVKYLISQFRITYLLRCISLTKLLLTVSIYYSQWEYYINTFSSRRFSVLIDQLLILHMENSSKSWKTQKLNFDWGISIYVLWKKCPYFFLTRKSNVMWVIGSINSMVTTHSKPLTRRELERTMPNFPFGDPLYIIRVKWYAIFILIFKA